MNNNIVVGVDIGGSHITAALIDLQAHAIIRDSLVRRQINSNGDADQIITEWTTAINDCKLFHPETSKKLGIAMPGPFDYETGVSLIRGLGKYESLYNCNVKTLLAESLNIEAADIFMMNDANCFLKGELFEDYVSTRWFIKEYLKRTGKTAGNVKEIKEQIPGNEIAASLFKEFGGNLGKVLAVYIEKHHAEAVVIGGNIINAWTLFMPETEMVLKAGSINVSLVKAMLGEEAALLGAGSLCS